MYPRSQLFPSTSKDRAYVLKELNYSEVMLKTDVESVWEWFQKQPHLVEAGISRDLIRFMIIISKCSVERAKQRIDFYYKHRRNMPEFFSDRMKYINDPIWDTFVIVPIPKLFKGRRVSIGKVLDADNINLENLVMKTYMMGDIRFLEEFYLGDLWIIDVEPFTFRHIMKLSLITLSKAAIVMHDATALRIFDIHIVNCKIANLGTGLLTLLNQFMSKKIFDRIQFHENYEGLHDFVPKEYLPKDYGGDLPLMAEWRDEIENIMTSEKSKQLLTEMCKLQSDESKRPKTDHNQDYMPGNFKKLEID